MWKAKISSHKLYLFGILFSRNGKKTDTDQSILQTFYSVWEETSHKPLKVAAS